MWVVTVNDATFRSADTRIWVKHRNTCVKEGIYYAGNTASEKPMFLVFL